MLLNRAADSGLPVGVCLEVHQAALLDFRVDFVQACLPSESGKRLANLINPQARLRHGQFSPFAVASSLHCSARSGRVTRRPQATTPALLSSLRGIVSQLASL